MAAGLRGAVALRVDQPAAAAVRIHFELARYEHLVAKVVPFLPVLIRKAKGAGVAVDALEIDTDRFLQVGLDHAGHGGNLRNLDRMLFQSVIFAQRFYTGNVHARAGAPAEIQRHLVRLLMVECRQYTFFGCHRNILLTN